MPFPSNDHVSPSEIDQKLDHQTPPWKKLHATEAMPMSFEVRRQNGEIETFTYGDFRGIKLLSAGYLIINVFAMEKTQIIVEGRHLGELASLISLGKIRWLCETPRTGTESPETAPQIDKITIEEMTRT